MLGNDKLDLILVRSFAVARVVAIVAVIVLMLLSIAGIFSPAGAQSEIPPTTGAPFDIPVGSDYLLATLVVGFLMSPVITFLSSTSWSKEAKGAAAFIYCAVASVILLFAGGQLDQVKVDAHSLFGTFLVVFVMAIGLYNFYFKNTFAAKLAGQGVK